MTGALLDRLRFENPVLAKELRTRMRGTRAFLVQGFYVGVLVLVMGIAYLIWWASYRVGAPSALVSSQFGRGLYLLVFEIQAGLVALITPALTAGTITIEHEQRTYEMLACTRISPRTILTGKLLSSWLFVAMLLTCSLPLAALCLMFGGVSLAEIFWAYVMLCACALFLGGIGVFYSALMTRSTASVMLTYGTVAAYLAATGIADPRLGSALWPLNPFAFIVDPTEPIRFFSLALPGWLPAVVILPLGALLLLNWGVSRLRHFAADRAIAIRGLTLLLFVALVLFGLGRAMAGRHPGPAWWGPPPGSPAGVAGCPYFLVLLGGAAALVVMSVFFVTGGRPGSKPQSLVGWLATGVKPQRMFSSELRGGWAYMLLLAGAFSALLAVGTRLSPRDALATFALAGAVLLCYSALGALGAAFNSRAAGVVLILLLMVVTSAVPGGMWLNYQSSRLYTGAQPYHYALYLAPWWGLSLVHEPSLSKVLPKNLLPPAAPPAWLVTAVLHLAVAGAALALAEVSYQAYRRRTLALAGGPGQQSWEK